MLGKQVADFKTLVMNNYRAFGLGVLLISVALFIRMFIADAEFPLGGFVNLTVLLIVVYKLSQVVALLKQIVPVIQRLVK